MKIENRFYLKIERFTLNNEYGLVYDLHTLLSDNGIRYDIRNIIANFMTATTGTLWTNAMVHNALKASSKWAHNYNQSPNP